MRKNYPSDISSEQFETIKPLLESAQEDCAAQGGVVRGVLCSAAPAQKRLPVAHAARGVFKVAHCARVLCDLE